MTALWHSFVFVPIYNLLMLFASLAPVANLGIAIILVTIAVKLILLPLTLKASLAQKKLRVLEPKMKEIREKHATDKDAQARKMMELYQEAKVNPFSGCLPVLIQIPVLFALYRVFLQEIKIDTSLLYSFTPHPATLDPYFLGLSLTEKSILLAVLAGGTQFILAWIMRANQPQPEAPKPGAAPDLQTELARSMQIQMLYVLPLMITVIASQVAAAVALYWVVSNMWGIAQERIVRSMKITI